jgi:hypothetical protein
MLVLSWAPASEACGFHDDVSMSRGALNWVYPDSLHVVGAISAAVMEKRLTVRAEERSAGDLFGAQYNATVRTLKRFGESLVLAPGVAAVPFSVVLVESMLWTRFESVAGELRAEFHIQGPQPGDLVVVTGDNVVREVGAGRLSTAEAHGLGLVRLYGSERQVAAFLDAFRAVASGQHSRNEPRVEPAGLNTTSQ